MTKQVKYTITPSVVNYAHDGLYQSYTEPSIFYAIESMNVKHIENAIKVISGQRHNSYTNQGRKLGELKNQYKKITGKEWGEAKFDPNKVYLDKVSKGVYVKYKTANNNFVYLAMISKNGIKLDRSINCMGDLGIAVDSNECMVVDNDY